MSDEVAHEVTSGPNPVVVANLSVSVKHSTVPATIHKFEFADGSKYETVTPLPPVPVVNQLLNKDPVPTHDIPEVKTSVSGEAIHTFIKKWEILIVIIVAPIAVWALSHWHLI